MKMNSKTHRLSVKLSDDYYERFQMIADGRGPSDTIRALIDGGYYLSLPQLAPACAEIMDAIGAVKGQCDYETYYRLEEGGKAICRLLLTRWEATEMRMHCHI